MTEETRQEAVNVLELARKREAARILADKRDQVARSFLAVERHGE